MDKANTTYGTHQWPSTLGRWLKCVWKDRKKLLCSGLVVAICGGIAGGSTRSVRSHAQLLLTPVTIRDISSADPVAELVPAPMDVKTATLLCTSDDTLSATLRSLNSSNQLDRRIGSIQELRDCLSHQIFIAKETPYDVEYSPIIVLSARQRSPTAAKLTVDAWAQACVEAASRFKEMQLKPMITAFDMQRERLKEELNLARQELEAFEREHRLEYYESRLSAISELISDYDREKASIQEDLEAAAARRLSLRAFEASEEPVLQLRWRPSTQLADPLAAVIGKQSGFEMESEDSAKSDEALLIQDTLNPVYTAVSQESVLAEADQAGYRAQLEAAGGVVEGFHAEREVLRTVHAETKRKQEELALEVLIRSEAYADIAAKNQYARTVRELAAVEVQLFGRGAEWHMPGIRRALLFALLSGILALASGAVLSIAIRQIEQSTPEDT